ncbi:MAG: pyridoxamine 5'-phosphate oxidase family protein [Desulfuromonas sp.]|nr:pyridoxamine 5'-phosphate oxidase family protein [Desulfuromonas sp.]
MTRETLQQFLAEPKQVGVLSTVDRQGNPNSAVIGSATMPQLEQLWIGLGDNHTLENLQHHPQAVFTAYQPADFLPAWQGARVYLHAENIDFDGPFKQQLVEQIEQQAGKQAARMIVAAVCFSIKQIRPLLDFKR